MTLVDFTFEGVQEAIKQARALAKDMPRKALRGAVRWAEKTMTVSKGECPVLTGALRNSGHVEVDEKKMSVSLLYGGPSAPYAAKQHETHKTKSKFLERPIMERIDDLPMEIRAEMEK